METKRSHVCIHRVNEKEQISSTTKAHFVQSELMLDDFRPYSSTGECRRSVKLKVSSKFGENVLVFRIFRWRELYRL